MNDRQSEALSPAGLARREAMLDELIDAVKRTHRTRRLRRQLLAAGGCACLLLVLVWLALLGASIPGDVRQFAEDSPDHPTGAMAENPPERQVCVTEVIQTDPTVLERYRARPTGRIMRMDDHVLLDTLAAIGRPAGLIRFGHRIRLSAPVTDVALGLRQ